MKYDFPKSARLRRSWEYQQVSKMGCKLHTPHFILLVNSSGSECPRLGLTISRKVGNAVIRNRIKRQLREFFRLNSHSYLERIDVSVIAKKGAAGISSESLYIELTKALLAKGYIDG